MIDTLKRRLCEQALLACRRRRRSCLRLHPRTPSAVPCAGGMSARARAAEAARKHLIVSGIGFAAALGVVKLTFPSAAANSEAADARSSGGSSGSAGSSRPAGNPGSNPGPGNKDELQLVQVVFRWAPG